MYHELVTQPVEGRSDLPTTVGLHELQYSLLPVKLPKVALESENFGGVYSWIRNSITRKTGDVIIPRLMLSYV